MSGLATKRPRFYQGQYLGADDLDALVTYLREQAARHRLGAHTWGIAMGLQLKEVESTSGGGEVDVYIQPGYAWDGFGNSVVVLAPYKVPPEKAKDLSSGEVKIWLRHAQSETGPPPPGFETCQTDEQYARVWETFEVVAGDFNRSAQRDKLLIAGSTVDGLVALHHLDAGDPLCCDESIPFQSLPDDADNPRWLIPLGCVTWEQGESGQAGRFKETTNPKIIKRGRSQRVYAGVVAEAVHAADGVIRLRNRGTPAPAAGSLSAACERERLDFSSDRDLTLDEDGKLSVEDLVWVEGNLRALGDIRLFGTKLDFQNNFGGSDYADDAGPLWMQRVEDNTPGPGGKDLQVVIGDRAEGRNRFSVGPLGESEGDPLRTRFTVLDNGNAGIGVEEPLKLLHLSGGNDPTILVETDATEGPSGRLSFRRKHSSTENGVDLYYSNTSGLRGLLIDTVAGGENKSRLFVRQDGHVGIGTTHPDHDLQIGDSTEAVYLALKGNDEDDKSSILAFSTDAGGTDRGFKVIHDTAADLLRIVSDNVNPILSCRRTAPCRVGIGTDAPRNTLDVRGGISLGSAGELFAVGGAENLRVVVGSVQEGGSSDSESFDSRRETDDSYKIEFTNWFSSAPAVVVTPLGEAIVASVVRADHREFLVRITDMSGASVRCAFNFIAFGSRV